MFSRLFCCLWLLAILPLAGCGSHNADDPTSYASGLARMGGQLREKGEIGTSIDFYRRALAADPKNLGAIKGLAAALEQWGDKPGAQAVYQEGVAARPKDGELRRDYAKLLIALDEPAEAKAQYEAALDIDSDDLKARNGLGIAYDYLGDHAKAQKQYEKVLKEDPKNLPTINNLAYSYILTHRHDRAIKLLEPLQNNKAATAAMRQNLALAYGLSGMEADAERVARMDLSPQKVKENLDYYRRQRAEHAVSTTPYAELGTYATEAMAVAQIQKIRAEVGKDSRDLKPVVLPEVAAPGGTPRFAVRMMGCAKPDDVTRLCQILAKNGVPCVPRGKGAETP